MADKIAVQEFEISWNDIWPVWPGTVVFPRFQNVYGQSTIELVYFNVFSVRFFDFREMDQELAILTFLELAMSGSMQ